jgi:ubiquinone/menaquinone biosynthesis C-methylase UbiE
MGFDVTSFDISQDALRVGKIRFLMDRRFDKSRISFLAGDGHSMPFSDETFLKVCCFDTLHHISDYNKVISEFHRILILGGRVIFVEPGSEHSKSKETIEFIKEHKSNDPEWIEKDIILSEIYKISKNAGFKSMIIKPFILPSQIEYTIHDWFNFKNNKTGKENYINNLIEFNNKSRVIFYLEK